MNSPMRPDGTAGVGTQAPAPKSSFVTGTAVMFIVFSAFATCMSLLQTIAMYIVLANADIDDVLLAGELEGLPPGAALLFEHMGTLSAASLALSVATLVASIGLLRRLNWARMLFIALMALGIACNLGGFALQLWVMRSVSDVGAGVPAELQSQFQAMTTAITAFGALIAIGFSAAFAWLVKRLLEPAIAAEFR